MYCWVDWKNNSITNSCISTHPCCSYLIFLSCAHVCVCEECVWGVEVQQRWRDWMPGYCLWALGACLIDGSGGQRDMSEKCYYLGLMNSPSRRGNLIWAFTRALFGLQTSFIIGWHNCIHIIFQGDWRGDLSVLIRTFCTMTAPSLFSVWAVQKLCSWLRWMYTLSLLCKSIVFILPQCAGQSVCKMTLKWVVFTCAPAGLLFSWSSVSSSELIQDLARQPSKPFHPPTQLQLPFLGLQLQLPHVLASPQCTAAFGFAGGPIVCEGVPERRTNLRTRLVSFHQH